MNKRIGFALIMTMILATYCAAQVQDSLGLSRNSLPTTSVRLYDEVLVEALVLQIKADSLARIARDLRIQVRETDNDSAKKLLTSGMISADKEAREVQRQADKHFALANSMKPTIEKQVPVENSSVQLSREINGIKVYQYTGDYRLEDEDYKLPEEPTVTIENTGNKKAGIPLKTDDFAILEKSPYSDDNHIPQQLEINAGLTYKIQLGVFSKIRPNDAFGGITPIAYEVVAGGSMFKYYAGIFYKMNSAASALEKVRSSGFPDAFMVAFFNGKPIPTEKAREIEFSEFKMSPN